MKFDSFFLLPIAATSFAYQKPLVQFSQKYATTRFSIPNGAIETEYNIDDSFNLIVLGDLHMEDDMSSHNEAREDCLTSLKKISLLQDSKGDSPVPVRDLVKHLEDVKAGDLSAAQLNLLLKWKVEGELMNSYLVSVGDLGRKDIRHEPGDAGTTKSFVDAKDFLDGFGLPYDLVTGNHDLEGLDEFETDAENLEAWMSAFDKDTPQFAKYVGEKTLLLGVSTVRFRSAPFSSHEVHVDDEQLKWFMKMVEDHPADEGWKLIVVSHAPPIGSGLRVLQSVHVVNGCAWLNHCSDNRVAFIQAVKDNPQIKLWFSGHFHLSHDFEDAISTVGSCTFVQCGVMGKVSTRDGKRQTRLVQGNSNQIKIFTVNHHERDSTNGEALLRLDAEIDLPSGQVTMAHGSEDFDHNDWFQAYMPEEEDGCYLQTPDGLVADPTSLDSKVCWWHMEDGKVLGVHQGQLVEYDRETLAPLGIVVDKKSLGGREVLLVHSGKALVLMNEQKEIEVVHPNDDGSYWRKYQRNKKVRQEEKAREAVARMWLEKSQKQ